MVGLMVDAIYVSEKKDMSLYQNAINMKSYKNIFTAVTHGHREVVVSGYERFLEDEIAERARKSGKSEILLIACYQGAGEYGNSAQEIANKSGLPVQYKGGSVAFFRRANFAF